MGKFDKYVKATNWYKNKTTIGGGGGSAGALEPEPYKPIDFNLFIKAPSTEEISQKQNVLLQYEKDYEAANIAIDANYELWKDLTKQLDDLEEELKTAPEDMEFNLKQKYDELRDQHNTLVDLLQKDTKRQKEIYGEYTKERQGFDKDIELYNRWAEAENRKPKELPPVDIEKQFETSEIAKQLKGKVYTSQITKDPTWGQMVYHSLRAGLNDANAKFWQVGRMLEMGKIKVEDKIDDLFFPGTEDRNKKFEEKYGKDPNFSLPLNILTDLEEEAGKRTTFSAAQAESKAFLKQSVNIGLRPLPLIGYSVLMGAAIPGATGLQAMKPWAEFMTAWKRMYPFGTLAGAGKSREIEKGYEALDKEAPYMKMLIGGVLAGHAEMATEMPIYLGVMKVLGFTGAGVGKIINTGAKAVVAKFGGAAYNTFLQGVQEAEMFWAGKAIDQALGDPQDWSPEEMVEGTWKDFYGGLCMGAVTLGIGGGVAGSEVVADKCKQAFQDFVDNKNDIKETMRLILEYQGIAEEEPKAEAFAYKVEPKVPVIPSYTPYEKMNMLKTGARVDRLKTLYNLLGKDVEKVEINGKIESIEVVIKRTQKQSNLPELEKASQEAPKPEELKVEPKLFEGKAYRGELPSQETFKTAQEKLDSDAFSFGNIEIKEELKTIAKELDIDLSEVASEDLLWVAKDSKIAEKFGEVKEVEVTKDTIVLKEDKEGGFLVLKNADKYREKVEPKAPDVISKEIVALHNKEGGVTYNLYDGDLIGKEKYAVSTYPDIGIEIKGKTITKEQIANFIDDNMDLLKDPVNSVGTWYDKESKKTYIDISKTVDTLEEAVALGKEYKQKAVFNLKTLEEIPVGKVEVPPPKPPVPPKKTKEEPEGEPKKSFEEKLKDAQKEINRLRGIIKTIKGNAKKRQEFKKELVAYIKKNMPYAIQNKMIATVKNVTGDKALVKAMDKIDQYTFEYYRRGYAKKIQGELTAKRIKPKRTKAGMLKGKFIPIVQDKLDFIRANMNEPRANALDKIQKLIDLSAKGKAVNVAEEIELLNMVGIKEMDLETLQSTLENIKHLKKEGRTLKGEKEDAKRAEHEKDIIKVLKVLTGKDVKIDEKSGKAVLDSSYKTFPKTKKWGLAKKAIDAFVNWQFHWDSLLDKLSALDKSKPFKSALSKIGDSVHYARVNNTKALEDVLNMIQIGFVEAYEAVSKKDILKITRTLREEVDLGEFKNSEGDLVHLVLTKEQIIKKVMQLDDPTLDKTFDEGMYYTEEIEEAIRGALSKKDLAWIEVQKKVYEYMWGRINPIVEDMWGIHFQKNPNYSGTIRRDIDIDIPEATLFSQDAFKFASILNPSLKTRSKTKQSLKYDDATASLMNYVMQMEHFIAWVKPLNDLRSVFGDKRVKSVIHELYGENVLNKVNSFLDDMTRDGVDKAKIIKAVDWLRFNFTRAILAKPHLGLKQIPSVLAYMTEMPVTDFVKGINNFWKNPIKNYRFLVEHSSYARARFGEGFERDIHGAMKSDYYHLLAHSHKISDLMMGFVRAGDKFAVMQGMWTVFHSETKGQTTKASAKNIEDALARGAILTDRTQPSFNIESLAAGQRGGSFLKLFTMFQTQPNKYFQLIANNARNFKYGRGSRIKAASNIVLAWAVLPMIFQFIGDGGKWIKRHQLRALILGAVNDVLVFGSMIKGMYGWLIKEAYGVQASPVFATLREMEYALAKIAKLRDPDKDITPEDIQKFCEHFAKGIGQVFGYPTPYGVQVVKAVQAKDYRQLLFSEYILGLENEKAKKKKPYVKSYEGDKYSKYLKGKYSDTNKYSKYLKKY